MRLACEELLLLKRLPGFHRSRLNFYMAWSDKDANMSKVREHVEEALYWCIEVEQSMLATRLRDDRVNKLRRDIDFSRQKLDEYEADEATEAAEAAEAAEDSEDTGVEDIDEASGTRKAVAVGDTTPSATVSSQQTSLLASNKFLRPASEVPMGGWGDEMTID